MEPGCLGPNPAFFTSEQGTWTRCLFHVSLGVIIAAVSQACCEDGFLCVKCLEQYILEVCLMTGMCWLYMHHLVFSTVFTMR